MKKILSTIALLIFIAQVFAQDTNSVQWLSFDSVAKAFYKKQKPILIWIYKKDNDSSQLMLKQTFENSEVAKYINILFYPIKLEATTHDTITFFNGQKFVHMPNQPYHQLVYTLLTDSISFPALVVFGKNAQGRVFYGFKDRDHIFPILIYYAENVYISTKYEEWEKMYFKVYPPGVPQIITRLFIHWVNVNDLDKKMKQQPRKIFIDVYDRYNIADNVMRLRVYNIPPIADYLNRHFYPVTVEARAQDTLIFNGKEYPPSDKYPYNTLAIKLLNGYMTFPAALVLDSTYKTIDLERAFLTPEVFYKIITYFGGDYYKTMSFKEYLNKYADKLEEKLKIIRQYER